MKPVKNISKMIFISNHLKMRDTLKKTGIEIRKFIPFFFFTKICKNLTISDFTRFANVSGTSRGIACKNVTSKM